MKYASKIATIFCRQYYEVVWSILKIEQAGIA